MLPLAVDDDLRPLLPPQRRTATTRGLTADEAAFALAVVIGGADAWDRLRAWRAEGLLVGVIVVGDAPPPDDRPRLEPVVLLPRAEVGALELRRGWLDGRGVDGVVAVPGAVVDLRAGRVRRQDGAEVRLTAPEVRAAAYLLARAGRAVSATELEGQVFGSGPPAGAAETLLARLAQKLEAEPGTDLALLQVPGGGRRLAAPLPSPPLPAPRRAAPTTDDPPGLAETLSELSVFAGPFPVSAAAAVLGRSAHEALLGAWRSGRLVRRGDRLTVADPPPSRPSVRARRAHAAWTCGRARELLRASDAFAGQAARDELRALVPELRLAAAELVGEDAAAVVRALATVSGSAELDAWLAGAAEAWRQDPAVSAELAWTSATRRRDEGPSDAARVLSGVVGVGAEQRARLALLDGEVRFLVHGPADAERRLAAVDLDGAPPGLAVQVRAARDYYAHLAGERDQARIVARLEAGLAEAMAGGELRAATQVALTLAAQLRVTSPDRVWPLTARALAWAPLLGDPILAAAARFAHVRACSCVGRHEEAVAVCDAGGAEPEGSEGRRTWLFERAQALVHAGRHDEARRELAVLEAEGVRLGSAMIAGAAASWSVAAALDAGAWEDAAAAVARGAAIVAGNPTQAARFAAWAVVVALLAGEPDRARAAASGVDERRLAPSTRATHLAALAVLARRGRERDPVAEGRLDQALAATEAWADGPRVAVALARARRGPELARALDPRRTPLVEGRLFVRVVGS